MKKTGSFTLLASLMASTAYGQEIATDLDALIINAAPDTSESYVLPDMLSATGTLTPVLETPQSVTVLTRRQFDDQNTQTVGQALRYSAGVLSEIDATTRYDSVFLRGFGNFGTDTNFVSHLDGLRLPRGQFFGQGAIDPFLLDRIDILRGPSALLYGQTSPGGLINMVSRNPDGTTGGEARFELGSNGRVQVGTEIHGVLDKNETLKYSLATMGRMSGTRYKDVDEARFGIAPRLVWEPTDQTSITLGAYYQSDPEGGFFNSVYPARLAPAFANELDRNLNPGDPNFDDFHREQYGIYASIDHAFTSDLISRTKLRYSFLDVDFQGIQPTGAAPTATGMLPRQAVQSPETVNAFAFDTSIEYRFAAKGISHRLLAGVETNWNKSDAVFRFGTAPDLDITNPVYPGTAGPFATFFDNEQTTNQAAIYLSDQIELGNFHTSLGIRHNWVDVETADFLTSTTTDQSSQATTYQAGLLYRFDNGFSPYVSYSTSFEPVVGVDANGNAFVPTEGDQIEIGLKYQPPGYDMLLTASAFDITQSNVRTPDSANPFLSVQTGEIRSRGLEFEARGQLTSNLSFIGAFTLLDTEVTKTNVAAALGNRPQAVPENFGSLWLNYGFDGLLTGFELGGGVRYVGESYADDANTIVSDSYTLVDLMARYDFGEHHTGLEGLEATFNVRNLFDKEYTSSCSFNTFCQFGESRTYTAGLRYKW
jgi:iron complex outermembrane receptor protein